MEAQLAQCITVSVDPTVSAEQRRLALEAFNRFKDNVSSIEAALNLCRSHGSDHVHHGALILIEHWVRVHWNSLSDEQHSHLKNEAFFYMSTLKCILSDAPHVKQAICRVVVEIVKREWPQKWPDFMPKLLALASGGPLPQTEIALLVLLRMAEDVVQLHTLDEAPRRRKEIHQTLLSSLPDCMAFFFSTLNANYRRSTRLEPNDHSKGNSNADVDVDGDDTLHRSRVKLLQSLLTTLACFLEFVQFKDFPLDDVIRMLCVLLNDAELRVHAAKCLCELAERKLKGAELEQLCGKFLQPDVLSEILRSAAASLNADTSENHAFLLALCGIIAGISKQVSLHIVEVAAFECSPSFVELVMAVDKLCRHPSCAVARLALGAMTSLMKIQHKHPEKLVYPEQLWHDVAATVIGRSSSAFADVANSNWDFEEECELRKTLSAFKSELAELLRVATSVQPGVVISQVGLTRLGELLQKPADEREWSAMSRYLDVACSTAAREGIALGDVVGQLTAAYDRLLATRLDDMSCQSHAISCCSSMLSAIVPNEPGDDSRLLGMLDAIFWMVGYERPGESRATRSKDVRDFRKHGTALLVRVALDFHDRLVRYFDKFRTLAMRSLSSDSISSLERQHFVEALTVLSNGLRDPAAQSTILEQVLSGEIAFFADDAALKAALTDVQHFAAFLGLLGVDDFERNAEQRVVLSAKLMTITGALKRCEVVAGRHVAFELLARTSTCLDRLLRMLWLFKELFAQPNIHPDIVQSVLCLGENDKYAIFGSNLPSCEFPSPRTPAAQTFMTNFQDALTVFFVAMSYRPEFYSLRPDIGSIIMRGFETLPNYKMQQYLHLIVKSFVKNCPESLLLPQLSPTFIPMMSAVFGYLERRWRTQRSIFHDEETGATLEELVEDQVTHHVSRDLIEIASYFVIDSTGSVKTSDDVGADTVAAVKSFGAQLLADEHACRCVVTIAFSALYAADSQTSFKSIALCSTLAFHLAQRPQVGDELCSLMYQSLLLSLRVHGDNGAHAPLLLTLGIQLYRWLVVCAARPSVRETLLAAGVRHDLLSEFEAALTADKPISARRRKDMFRTMVEHLLGTSVSEMGKQPVRIVDHEPLWKMPKPEIDALQFVNLGDSFAALR